MFVRIFYRDTRRDESMLVYDIFVNIYLHEFLIVSLFRMTKWMNETKY
jgi:hypothetical protein